MKGAVISAGTGVEEDTDIQPRDMLIDLQTREVEPEAVAMQRRRVATVHIAQGLESPTPERPEPPTGYTLIAHVRLSRLEREEAAIAQYRDNIGALRSRLSTNESLLSAVNQDLLQVRDLLVWAADGANTSEDLNAMANNLVALRDSLFYTANSLDQEGRYVFSGTLSNTPTIAYDPLAAVGGK